MRKKAIMILFISISYFLAANPSRAQIVSSLFRSVEKWMGSSYKYGGTSKDGIDCSGFTANVYSEVFNFQLPRTVSKQKELGMIVKGKLEPGDLLFFNINGSISHIGIYVFDRKFIHAASSGPEVGVIKSSLKEKYYRTRFAYAKRVITIPPFKTDKKIIEDLILGTNIYKGKIFNISDEFTSNRPIYIQIKTDPEITKELIVEFNDQSSNESRKIKMNISSNSENVGEIYLEKGSYNINVRTEKNEIIYKKNIIVN